MRLNEVNGNIWEWVQDIYLIDNLVFIPARALTAMHGKEVARSASFAAAVGAAAPRTAGRRVAPTELMATVALVFAS